MMRIFVIVVAIAVLGPIAVEAVGMSAILIGGAMNDRFEREHGRPYNMQRDQPDEWLKYLNTKDGAMLPFWYGREFWTKKYWENK